MIARLGAAQGEGAESRVEVGAAENEGSADLIDEVDPAPDPRNTSID